MEWETLVGEERESREGWEGRISIPRVMGGPCGGVGIGLSAGVLVEVEGSGSRVRVVSLGWAGVSWEPGSGGRTGSLAVQHPQQALWWSGEGGGGSEGVSGEPGESEVVLWSGMRIRWSGEEGPVRVVPPTASAATAWRLQPTQLYWSPDAHPPPPILDPSQDASLLLFPDAKPPELPSATPSPSISPAARRMAEEAIVIPNSKEETMTMIIGGWKIRQELREGEVRVESAGGEGGLRINPSTRELSLNSPDLRLYLSSPAAALSRCYLRASHGRSLRQEGPRLSINQTPSFFDHHGNLFL